MPNQSLPKRQIPEELELDAKKVELAGLSDAHADKGPDFKLLELQTESDHLDGWKAVQNMWRKASRLMKSKPS